MYEESLEKCGEESLVRGVQNMLIIANNLE